MDCHFTLRPKLHSSNFITYCADCNRSETKDVATNETDTCYIYFLHLCYFFLDNSEEEVMEACTMDADEQGYFNAVILDFS
jgi:hypothetical protein